MATILHADLDSFFASVEQRDDPRLRGRPVLVGGGVVLAASYEAKAHGVRTPMPLAKARALCPGARVVPPRFDAYSAASRAVFEVFRDTSPLVEGISIDEAFLEVGGLLKLRGTPERIAIDLRKRVLDEVGLPITVGIARTKFLAKIASAVAKPDGLLRVDPAGELAFLHPLPIERLWGVGVVTSAKLRAHGIHTVGDIAQSGPRLLSSIVGGHSGEHLYALSQVRDVRRVTPQRRRRSIGAQRALGRGPRSSTEVAQALTALVDRVCARLRESDRRARGVTLRLRLGDYSRITRSTALGQPTAATADILATTLELLHRVAGVIDEKGLTLIGVSVGPLTGDGADQLELPFGGEPGELDSAVDGIHARFGSGALTRAVHVGRDTGYAMPTLPD